MGSNRVTTWRYRWHELGRIRRAYRWLRWLLPVVIRILITDLFYYFRPAKDPEQVRLINRRRINMAWYRAGAFKTITETLNDFPERG